MINVLSIDLESWVHINPSNKDSTEVRKRKDNGYIIKATEDILTLFKKYNTKATFFVITEVYEWYPKLIEKIKKEGHEIAMHTQSHKKLSSKYILEGELKKASNFIKRFKPKGFRAPMIYFKEEYFDVLKNNGFDYDSSTYGGPIKKYNGVLEIPVSTYRNKDYKKFPRELTPKLMLTEIPIGSGYFIGLLGSLIIRFIRKINKNSRTYVMFIHPWQIKTPPIGFIEKVKNPPMWPYYMNRKETLASLLKNFKFTSFEKFLKKTKFSL
jgi:peptidoglycan-N-acetylglucosamine deacetylase